MWADEGRGWWGLLFPSLFRGFGHRGGFGYHCLLSLAISRLWREKRVTLGIEGDLVADPDGLEGYGCKREIVVGVVLFHKLIEAECHIDWNVQNLALFAEVLVA